jgi:hypothetical protein
MVDARERREELKSPISVHYGVLSQIGHLCEKGETVT